MFDEGKPAADWLNADELDAAKEAQAQKALEFAQQHLFFKTDPRAAALLQFWKDTVIARRVPVGSSLDAYAAAEAVRGFVGEIERQLKIAETGQLA